MARILINDGIHPTGAKMLTDAGHDVDLNNIPQQDLVKKLPGYDAICVRSATKVRSDLIDVCPNLKVIGRGGVGLDNIDVNHAKSKGISVVNTPAASSRSVAELAFAHLFSVARHLFQSNRTMPSQGDTEFKSLKKSFSKGIELEGKTLGIIGFGRIGQEVARMALGLGMNVMAVDSVTKSANVRLGNTQLGIDVTVHTVPLDLMLEAADIISLHIPYGGEPVLSHEQFDAMKDGVIIINAARGGTIDEEALLDALDDNIVSYAGLDVFENEPTPRQELLHHPCISLTPHTGASTVEAQEKIGIELAQQLIHLLK